MMIRVEAACGDTPASLVAHMIALASTLKVAVTCDFNGYDLDVYPSDDVTRALDRFKQYGELRSTVRRSDERRDAKLADARLTDRMLRDPRHWSWWRRLWMETM